MDVRKIIREKSLSLRYEGHSKSSKPLHERGGFKKNDFVQVADYNKHNRHLHSFFTAR